MPDQFSMPSSAAFSAVADKSDAIFEVLCQTVTEHIANLPDGDNINVRFSCVGLAIDLLLNEYLKRQPNVLVASVAAHWFIMTINRNMQDIRDKSEGA